MPEFGDHRRGCHLCHTAQCLQPGDHFLDLSRSQRSRFVNLRLQALDAAIHVIDLLHVIFERGLQRELVKLQALDPSHVPLRPARHLLRLGKAVPQQKLSETLPGPMPILCGGFALTHQVAQGFVVLIGNPNRRPVSTAIAARQLRGITPVGHALAGFGGDERRNDHFAGDAQLR